MRLILIVLILLPNLYASSDTVVKLGADSKKYKEELITLNKEVRIIGVKLNNLDNTLAIPSHALGEINKLERALQRAHEVSMVSELLPSLKGKGQEFRTNIKEIQPSVQKAREVSDEISKELVNLHKKIKETKSKVKDIYSKVTALIEKDLPKFHTGMTETQDCVYKVDQTKRECMQEELNSAAEDLRDVIKDSNKEVVELNKTLSKLRAKIDNLKQVLKNTHTTITEVQKLEFKVSKTIVPFLDLYRLMNKDYEIKFLMPNPYKPKKNMWFYMKITGKDIAVGVLHTMDEIEKKLKGELLKQANKASVKKLAEKLSKDLDKDLQSVIRRLHLNFKFSAQGITDMHKLEKSLIDPLEDLVSAMKEIKLEVSTPKATACDALKKECR